MMESSTECIPPISKEMDPVLAIVTEDYLQTEVEKLKEKARRKSKEVLELDEEFFKLNEERKKLIKSLINAEMCAVVDSQEIFSTRSIGLSSETSQISETSQAFETSQTSKIFQTLFQTSQTSEMPQISQISPESQISQTFPISDTSSSQIPSTLQTSPSSQTPLTSQTLPTSQTPSTSQTSPTFQTSPKFQTSPASQTFQTRIPDSNLEDKSLNPHDLHVMHKIGDDSLLLGWKPSMSSAVKGYEIYVDGVLRHRVRSVTRSQALLEHLDLSKSMILSIHAVTTQGMLTEPTQLMYVPQYDYRRKTMYTDNYGIARSSCKANRWTSNEMHFDKWSWDIPVVRSPICVGFALQESSSDELSTADIVENDPEAMRNRLIEQDRELKGLRREKKKLLKEMEKLEEKIRKKSLDMQELNTGVSQLKSDHKRFQDYIYQTGGPSILKYQLDQGEKVMSKEVMSTEPQPLEADSFEAEPQPNLTEHEPELEISTEAKPADEGTQETEELDTGDASSPQETPGDLGEQSELGEEVDSEKQEPVQENIGESKVSDYTVQDIKAIVEENKKLRTELEMIKERADRKSLDVKELKEGMSQLKSDHRKYDDFFSTMTPSGLKPKSSELSEEKEIPDETHEEQVISEETEIPETEQSVPEEFSEEAEADVPELITDEVVEQDQSTPEETTETADLLESGPEETTEGTEEITAESESPVEEVEEPMEDIGAEESEIEDDLPASEPTAEPEAAALEMETESPEQVEDAEPESVLPESEMLGGEEEELESQTTPMETDTTPAEETVLEPEPEPEVTTEPPSTVEDIEPESIPPETETEEAAGDYDVQALIKENKKLRKELENLLLRADRKSLDVSELKSNVTQLQTDHNRFKSYIEGKPVSQIEAEAVLAHEAEAEAEVPEPETEAAPEGEVEEAGPEVEGVPEVEPEEAAPEAEAPPEVEGEAAPEAEVEGTPEVETEEAEPEAEAPPELEEEAAPEGEVEEAGPEGAPEAEAPPEIEEEAAPEGEVEEAGPEVEGAPEVQAEEAEPEAEAPPEVEGEATPTEIEGEAAPEGEEAELEVEGAPEVEAEEAAPEGEDEVPVPETEVPTAEEVLAPETEAAPEVEAEEAAPEGVVQVPTAEVEVPVTETEAAPEVGAEEVVPEAEVPDESIAPAPSEPATPAVETLEPGKEATEEIVSETPVETLPDEAHEEAKRKAKQILDDTIKKSEELIGEPSDARKSAVEILSDALKSAQQLFTLAAAEPTALEEVPEEMPPSEVSAAAPPEVPERPPDAVIPPLKEVPPEETPPAEPLMFGPHPPPFPEEPGEVEAQPALEEVSEMIQEERTEVQPEEVKPEEEAEGTALPEVVKSAEIHEYDKTEGEAVVQDIVPTEEVPKPEEAPSEQPTEVPVEEPEAPTAEPTAVPAEEIEGEPLEEPEAPTAEPTAVSAEEIEGPPPEEPEAPTAEPTAVPAEEIEGAPPEELQPEPTEEPALVSAEEPTEAPAEEPAVMPTEGLPTTPMVPIEKPPAVPGVSSIPVESAEEIRVVPIKCQLDVPQGAAKKIELEISVKRARGKSDGDIYAPSKERGELNAPVMQLQTLLNEKTELEDKVHTLEKQAKLKSSEILTLKMAISVLELRQTQVEEQLEHEDRSFRKTRSTTSIDELDQKSYPAMPNTVSRLHSAIAALHNKCREKDMLINALADDLRIRARSGIFEDLVKDIERIDAQESMPTTNLYDFDATQLSQYLRPPDGTGITPSTRISRILQPNDPPADVYFLLTLKPPDLMDVYQNQ